MKKSVVIILSCAVCVVFAIAVIIVIKSGVLPTNRNNVTTSESVTETVSETLSPTVMVTFPEGFSLSQIAERLEENSVCNAKEFMQAANDPELYETFSLLQNIEDREHRAFVVEGYIFPDTYEFYRGENPETALWRFLTNAETKLSGEVSERAAKIGYTVDEVLAIASIIQKEAGIQSEMGKVSSVLHNRLNDSYNRLSCDVTINYLNEYVIPYIDGDTERYNEYYNTYKCFGLPKGPICNPGLEAIKAALSPEDTPYFYFVTDDDNNYYYSETYEGHKENCTKVGIY